MRLFFTKIIGWVAGRQWEFFGLLLILLVILVNRFPEGYVIAGEDTFQHINQTEHFWRLIYDWQGKAGLFYGVFYLLDRLHISETAQLSWYLGIFLIGSYLSFLGFCRLIAGKIDRIIATAGALFYALNLYTLYVFTYSWGYSHFQILYVFIPILTGTYIAFLRSSRIYYAILFLLFLFLSSSGFANPAFAVSLGIYFLFLTVFLFLSHIIPWKRQTFSRVAFLALSSLLLNAYWILPLIPQIDRGVSDLAETNSIDLGWWLQKTSNPISETLRLGQFNSGSFFPLNNPYQNFDFIEPLFLALSFLPIIIILIGIWYGRMREKRYRSFFWIFFTLLLIFVALNARVRPPFEGLNNFIFHLPGLNTLRSYEKIAIFTPFLLSALLAFTLMRAWVGRSRSFVIAAMVLILLLPLPFYIGKLQQNMSFIMSQRSKDFQKSSHSFLVKIPEQYYEAKKILNDDADNFKIVAMPYNTDKLGWVSYPVWKMRGNDITAALYRAPLINPNSPYAEQWLFAQDFNERHEDPIWLVRWLGILNAKYIIYHKDVHDEFLEQSLKKMLHLQSIGALETVSDNEYFTLYQINDKYVSPYVYLNSGQSTLSSYSIEGVFESAEKIKTSQEALPYEMIHPRKILVPLSGDNLTGNKVTLSERYDPLWRAIYRGEAGRILLVRDTDVTYANAWRLDKNMREGSITIEYLPMKLFFIGAGISGSVLLTMVMYLAYDLFARRKRK